MATKKLQTPNTANPTADQAFINSIFAETKSEPAPTAEPTPSETKAPAPAETGNNTAKQEKAKITFLVSKATAKDWKQFCLTHDLTLTDTIQIAMNHIIDEVENHNAKISKGGFRK